MTAPPVPGASSVMERSAADIASSRPDLAPTVERWRIPAPLKSKPLDSLGRLLPDSWFEDRGVRREDLGEYLSSALSPARADADAGWGESTSLRILGGATKTGERETLDLALEPGTTLAVVGPTGAGKSRFLADIECLAQGDTPSGRRVLLNGAVPDPSLRYAAERRPVALLSQTMNFVMDLPADEFVAMHAECRGIADAGTRVAEILDAANDLAGERFGRSTPLARLSGGQSRALMIADTALLSRSPIVLIDEIENAGVDRKRALELFLGAGKILILSTHDPALALLADRRLVIRDGGAREQYERNGAEGECLRLLQAHDAALEAVREDLRRGRRLSPERLRAALAKGETP